MGLERRLRRRYISLWSLSFLSFQLALLVLSHHERQYLGYFFIVFEYALALVILLLLRLLYSVVNSRNNAIGNPGAGAAAQCTCLGYAAGNCRAFSCAGFGVDDRINTRHAGGRLCAACFDIGLRDSTLAAGNGGRACPTDLIVNRLVSAGGLSRSQGWSGFLKYIRIHSAS